MRKPNRKFFWLCPGLIALAAAAFIFFTAEKHPARAQAEPVPTPKSSPKSYVDLINWSWKLEFFGYVGSVAINLKKETAEKAPEKAAEI